MKQIAYFGQCFRQFSRFSIDQEVVVTIVAWYDSIKTFITWYISV